MFYYKGKPAHVEIIHWSTTKVRQFVYRLLSVLLQRKPVCVQITVCSTTEVSQLVYTKLMKTGLLQSWNLGCRQRTWKLLASWHSLSCVVMAGLTYAH